MNVARLCNVYLSQSFFFPFWFVLTFTDLQFMRKKREVGTNVYLFMQITLILRFAIVAQHLSGEELYLVCNHNIIIANAIMTVAVTLIWVSKIVKSLIIELYEQAIMKVHNKYQ